VNQIFNSKRRNDLIRLEFLRESNCVEAKPDQIELNDKKHNKSKFQFLLPFQQGRQEQAILLELPILLESLILLVESGLGILPAIHKLLESSDEETKSKSARYYLRVVHEMSMRGLPFGQALENVASICPFPALRHFFLHLDIGANVGGKLGNSLRSLAQHAHQEWKLSVEARVRKLENLVVFPVFASVIGLILLTASVPLIPLLELKDKLDNAQSGQSGLNQHYEEPGQ